MANDLLNELLRHVTGYDVKHPGNPVYGYHGLVRIDEGEKTVQLTFRFPHPESTELYERFVDALGDGMPR